MAEYVCSSFILISTVRPPGSLVPSAALTPRVWLHRCLCVSLVENPLDLPQLQRPLFVSSQ
jgi:hypothetical protein